jgi:hypothetical protein
MRRVEILAVVWQGEIRAQQRRQRRGGVGHQHHGTT